MGDGWIDGWVGDNRHSVSPDIADRLSGFTFYISLEKK